MDPVSRPGLSGAFITWAVMSFVCIGCVITYAARTHGALPWRHFTAAYVWGRSLRRLLWRRCYVIAVCHEQFTSVHVFHRALSLVINGTRCLRFFAGHLFTFRRNSISILLPARRYVYASAVLARLMALRSSVTSRCCIKTAARVEMVLLGDSSVGQCCQQIDDCRQCITLSVQLSRTFFSLH